MENWILITIAIVFIGIPTINGIIKLVRIFNSDKITFINGDKTITVSTKPTLEDRKKLLQL